jgi:hypothetical protein
MKRKVVAISDNDMVHEMNAHQFASPLDTSRQFFIVFAWMQIT